MRKVSDIYKEYKIMPNLQEHMFRVASIASVICDHIDEKVDKETIITAALLHDMGNIVKFNLDLFPEFNGPEGIEHWRKVQNEFIEKYGKDDHQANVKIMEELNLPDEVLSLVRGVSFDLFCDHRNSNNIKQKILSYADTRVGPYGVLSYDERMNEAKKRYTNKVLSLKEDLREKLMSCGKDTERQIFSRCNIKPEDIKDESIAPIISSLRDFVIK